MVGSHAGSVLVSIHVFSGTPLLLYLTPPGVAQFENNSPAISAHGIAIPKVINLFVTAFPLLGPSWGSLLD